MICLTKKSIKLSLLINKIYLYTKIPIVEKDDNMIAFTKNIGFILLAVYLILVGISSFTPIILPSIIIGIIALLAGIFILIGR